MSAIENRTDATTLPSRGPPPRSESEVGRVQASFGGGFADDDGCHWVFPPGIFSYDLQAP